MTRAIRIHIYGSSTFLYDLLDYGEAYAYSLVVLSCCSKQLSKTGEKFWDVLLFDANSIVYNVDDQDSFFIDVAGLNLDFSTSLRKLHSVFYQVYQNLL